MSESDPTSSADKKRRVSSSGRAEGLFNAASGSNSDADERTHEGRPSSLSTNLPHKTPSNHALLHLLDGHFVKRHTVEPWNTSGGFCDVFIGDHPVFGKVAMKRPRITEEGATESQLQAFRREGEIWKELRHPNVLLFVGMILSDSRVWLISTFAEKGNLLKYIRENPTADRYDLVRQFTSGLAYLHSKSIVHEDLKSKNLLISAKSQLLIADFGLSKLEGTYTDTSNRGAGTAGWMAPELLFAANPAKSSASDVYAYGITISEIIRGEEPFKNYNNDWALKKDVSENNLRPPTTPREPYETLWVVAEACWDARPSKRPSIIRICDQFSLDYTEVIKGGNSNQVSGQTEVQDARSEGTHPVQDNNLNSQSVGLASPSNDVPDTHLLQLLDAADYGDSGHMTDDGLCLTGTRVEILERLDNWADTDSSPRVMLLKGQAGRGKSTIARSVALRYRERWGDAASSAIFHFHRGNKDLDTRLLRALAHQLGRSRNPRVRSAVLKSIQTWHDDDARVRLEKQFEILFVQSFKELEPNPPRILLIIDALDECSDLGLLSALLRLIPKHASSLPSTVKFLLTSRPEDHIIRPFNASFREGHEDLDAVDVGVIDRDVRAYFTTRLFEIQRYYGLESAWVSPKAINELVSLSQGLFQWAHAAMEYVREQPDPRLQQLVWSPTAALGLPSLYQQILSTAFPLRNDVSGQDSLPGLLQHVIGSLVVSQQPMSPSILEYLWDHHADRPSWSDLSKEIHNSILGRLGSILILPTSPGGPIHFMHTSIRDFFTNPAQCTDARFLIEPAKHHARLADICFRRMTRDLKHDICEINDPSRMNSEVVDLVECRISAGLRYCCRFWSTHLSDTRDAKDVDYNMLRLQLDEFCMGGIMHWLEVLSLIGKLSEVFEITRRATTWVERDDAIRAREAVQTTVLLDDTFSFCRRFFELMAINAQQISLSFLIHFPNETTLRTVYSTSIGQQVPQIVRGPPLQASHWSRTIPMGELYSIPVILSPGGETLASGLENNTIQMWNTYTGEAMRKPLVGHVDDISSVAFSPDGTFLASGSYGEEVRLWNVATGQQMGEPLVGHTDGISSVAFSPDGSILASGSYGDEIWLWNIATGQQMGEPLVGHTDGISSVAFSPDGTVLASGSDDHTVRLWSIATEQQMPELLGSHTQRVTGIAFSPDGKILASGSRDGTVRLWSVATKQHIGEPLVGDTSLVKSIAFSPDSKILASGLHNGTIRLWSVATGQQMGELLVGPMSAVDSIVFAPDGKIFASGSYVSGVTIQLWGAAAEHQMAEPRLVGNAKTVYSVTVSPDGKVLASWMEDGTICLWSIATGQQIGEPLVGDMLCYRTPTFSPDGKIFAYVSSDKTIRLWNITSEQQMGKLLLDSVERVHSLAFSPNGEMLASGSSNGIILFWNVATGHQMNGLLVGRTEWVHSIAFSPDGNILASGLTSGAVRLWSVPAGHQIGGPLIGHTHWVSRVTFSPDGMILASGSWDHTVRLWSVDTQQQMGQPLIGHTMKVDSITFSPDGKILTSESHKEIHQWCLGHRQPTTSQGHQETHSQIHGTSTCLQETTKGPVGTMEALEVPGVLGVLESLKLYRVPGGFPNECEHLINSVAADPSVDIYNADLKNDFIQPDLLVDISDVDLADASGKGWVFLRGKRCFWLPEEYYLDQFGKRVKISLSGVILVLWHQNINILDISAFL